MDAAESERESDVTGGAPASQASISLKTLAGLILIAGPLSAGAMGRPAGIAALFAIGFSIAKVVTGRELWNQMLTERGPSALPAMISATIVVQSLLVAVLFLIGRGLGAVFGYGKLADVLGRFDFILVSLVLALGVGAVEVARRR